MYLSRENAVYLTKFITVEHFFMRRVFHKVSPQVLQQVPHVKCRSFSMKEMTKSKESNQ